MRLDKAGGVTIGSRGGFIGAAMEEFAGNVEVRLLEFGEWELQPVAHHPHVIDIYIMCLIQKVFERITQAQNVARGWYPPFFDGDSVTI